MVRRRVVGLRRQPRGHVARLPATATLIGAERLHQDELGGGVAGQGQLDVLRCGRDHGAVGLESLGRAVEVVLGEEVGRDLGVADRQRVIHVHLGVDLDLVAEQVLRIAQVLGQE